MPGVKFYYGNDEDLKAIYGSYMGGNNWNSPGAITDAPDGGPNDYIMTEEGILDTLKNRASSYAKTEGVKDGDRFFKIIVDLANGDNPNEIDLYILKGVHTKPELHFTVALFGQLYHLNVRRLGSDHTRFSIHSMSAGGQIRDDEQWTVVKK